MQVQVEDRLSRRCIAIHRHAVTVVGYTIVFRDLLRRQKQFANDRVIAIFKIVDRRNVLTRNNQHMRRRLRIDVAKSDRIVRLEYDIRRYFSVQNFAKQTVCRSHMCP